VDRLEPGSLVVHFTVHPALGHVIDTTAVHAALAGAPQPWATLPF
jgi:hypothetical protein